MIDISISRLTLNSYITNINIHIYTFSSSFIVSLQTYSNPIGHDFPLEFNLKQVISKLTIIIWK